MTITALVTGRLIADPERRTSASGKDFATARLAAGTDDDSVLCSVIAFGHVAEQLAALAKGAKWEQFLSGELHIDHITPRAAFDLTDVDEVRACWSLGNLRLLKAKDNLRKKDRIEVLL